MTQKNSKELTTANQQAPSLHGLPAGMSIAAAPGGVPAHSSPVVFYKSSEGANASHRKGGKP